MSLVNILLNLKPQGRSKLVDEINEVYRVVNSVTNLCMEHYFKHKTSLICKNYFITSHQLTDITKIINDSSDKDERVLRRYMLELKELDKTKNQLRKWD